MVKEDSPKAEEIILATQDPVIDEAIAFFRAKLDYLRSPERIIRKAVGAKKNLFTLSQAGREESNLSAVNSALSYCHFAIIELERMKLAPAPDLGKIERIKERIPSIDICTEY
jgi:hypothetical protein